MGLLGDAWTVLVLRDVARGRSRFEQLLAESGISRKVLAARLRALEEAEVLVRVAYQERPVRHDYCSPTAAGRCCRSWPGCRSGETPGCSATVRRAPPPAPSSAEAQRVAALVGTAVPPLPADPLAAASYTVLYCYPGTALAGIDEVPGGPGCTLESCTYRDRLADFAALGARVVGVSTQLPEEQAAFAADNRIQFPLVSDADLALTTALRLPTFRLQGVTRLKRLTLVVDAERVVRGHAVPDPRRHRQRRRRAGAGALSPATGA